VKRTELKEIKERELQIREREIALLEHQALKEHAMMDK